MKFNQTLTVDNREGGGASLVSGRLSAGLGVPGSCPPPLRAIWYHAIGPSTARGAGLFVCSFSYWSVVSFPSASCQLYLVVSSEFVPPIPTLMWNLGGSHFLSSTIFFSLLLLLCFLLHPVCWSCLDVIGVEALGEGHVASKLPSGFSEAQA